MNLHTCNVTKYVIYYVTLHVFPSFSLRTVQDASIDELITKISKINGIPVKEQRILYTSKNLRVDLFLHDPLSYFSFQPVLHDWCNKGRGMCNPVCGMVHIKEPLLLIGKSSLCGGNGFHFSLSEWSLTICLTPHNRK